MVTDVNIDVLAIGELLVDVISDDLSPSVGQAKSFNIFQGGSPANVCANLNWLGIRSALVSCVGSDSLGAMLTRELSSIGVDSSHISVSDAYPTSIVMVARSQGTPDFIAYRMADTKIPPVERALIARSSIIHTTAFALSQEPARSSILVALKEGRQQGKVISVDWNFAPQLWGDDGKEVFAAVCGVNLLLKMSMDDVERFSARSLTVDQARNFLDSVEAKIICLTCGKDGVWYKEDGLWNFKAAVPVKVKDTTGAGDAFWSGFISSYVKKLPAAACIDHGLAVAAQKIQKVGPLYGA